MYNDLSFSYLSRPRRSGGTKYGYVFGGTDPHAVSVQLLRRVANGTQFAVALSQTECCFFGHHKRPRSRSVHTVRWTRTMER